MDQLRAIRWPLVAVALAVTLGLLFLGNWLLRATTVEEPLETFLQSQPAVETYAVQRDTRGRKIQVTLREVPNLAETYTELEAGLEPILGPADAELIVQDHRTPELTAAYYRINPLLHEAMATGRYGRLLGQVEERAAAAGLDRAEVRMDGRRLYLQLHKDEDYLYAVLPRPDASTTRGGLARGAAGGWGP